MSAGNPYAVADRVTLSQKKRVGLWFEHKGVCVICKLKIVGAWIVEHVTPLWLWPDGTPKEVANAWENLGPACVKCAREKTDKEATARAKTRRIVARQIGAYRPKGRPMPGSKASGWKKTFSDGWVKR